MQNKTKIIITTIFIFVITLALLALNSGTLNNSVISNEEYTNDTIGITMSIPEGYQVKEEKNNVRLFTEGGPIGDSIYFESEEDRQKGFFIFHVESSSTNAFESFENYHKGDPVLIERMENIAENAILITHESGKILVFTPENTDEYFEFHAGAEIENSDELLSTVYESLRKF